MKKIIILFSSLILVACNDPYEGNIAPAYEDYPIATLLEKNPETFSMWTTLLKHINMFNTMNLNESYTCFVPENNAMSRYLSSKGYTSVEDIPIEDGKLLIKYHTIKGKAYSQSQFESGVIPDTTATGDYLSIEFREGGLNGIYVNGTANIHKLDINATNGIVHSLNDVLIPITATVWDEIDNNAYSILAQAVRLTGYDEKLDKISEILTGDGGEIRQKKIYFTLFAVSDEIYRQNGIGNVEELIAYLAAESDYANPQNALNKYVAYHLLDQQMDYASLADFPEGQTSKNITTLAENELISLTDINNTILINYSEDAGSGISIITENINVKNGIIHAVDRPMIVTAPPRLKVIWELTDYSDLAGLFPNEYRKSTLSSTTSQKLVYGGVPCYKWEAVPSGNNNDALSYVVYHKGDAVRFEMTNHDCLSLQLGIYGWIEMETPAIVQGTYTMSIRHYSAASASKYGKFSAIVDGNYVGSEVTTHGSSSSAAKLITSTIGTVTFDRTKTHAVRLLQSDNNGIQLDYMEFTPVN
jgi:uncharacterized surface protein with fasciclin (FAS1) repeats